MSRPGSYKEGAKRTCRIGEETSAGDTCGGRSEVGGASVVTSLQILAVGNLVVTILYPSFQFHVNTHVHAMHVTHRMHACLPIKYDTKSRKSIIVSCED